MDVVIEYIPRFIDGTKITILLIVTSTLVCTLLGLGTAMMKLSHSQTMQRIGGFYTTIIRGIPDLVLMLLLYYGGQIGLNKLGEVTGLWDYIEINHFVAATLIIGFVLGAYMAETFRGAYLAIPAGQIEAGIACGMSGWLCFRRIIWPQLMRYALQSYHNNFLVLMKTTALASVIGLQEVVYMAYQAGRSTRMPFTFLFATLVIYLVLTIIADIGFQYLERKYNVGVRRS